MEAARTPHEDEIGRLAELHRLAVATATPERGGEVFAARETAGEPLEDWLRERLRNGGVWAGTVDDSIIGYAVADVENLRGGVRLARIEALFVEEGARGVGVGASMMAAIIEWSAEQGCTGVDAWALPGDRHTKNFFEASGFSARLLTMHHSFGPRRERPESEGGGVRGSRAEPA
ncbi:MAG: GNAT family N-acetyltransferase [Actinobacteria bacterium]|nr:GNAT family N-acetyltransferase [Actinomycetota bacterium]